MAKLAAALLVALAFEAVVASSTLASRITKPAHAGLVAVYSGPGHAPGEPRASVRSELNSLRLWRSARHLEISEKSCNPIPYYQKYEFKNPYGVVLVSYYEQVYYCRAKGLVTYFYRYRWAKVSSIVPLVHWTPWAFDGNVTSGNDCAGEHCFIRGFKAPNRTAVTKGSFRTCLIPIINAGCNYLYPVIWITVHGDGRRADSGWSD